ncbi:hypothetical protein [Pseudonocardia xishanensis]|uniref:Carboxypeptidase regulatory-like domain-containing protein n=1 Tax=Pseudonocardia xishanensis TaxID=630995 RepID=A0ABP8RC48_9PSEU
MSDHSQDDLDRLLGIVDAHLEADELMAEPVTEEELAEARKLVGRFHQRRAVPDDLDLELFLLLAAEVSYRDNPATEAPRSVSAVDPATGGRVVVRAGRAAGSWNVRLGGASAGRYRVTLAWGQEVVAVEIELRDGMTGQAVIPAGPQQSAPDRVRVERLAG